MAVENAYTIKLVQENDGEMLSGIFSKAFSEADKERKMGTATIFCN